MIGVSSGAAVAAAPQRTQKYRQRGHGRPASRSTRVPLMADAENVTRWIVDQQFRDTQIQLGIPLGRYSQTHLISHCLISQSAYCQLNFYPWPSPVVINGH